jgi:uncharacterized repeat protein (TIGR03806 family)
MRISVPLVSCVLWLSVSFEGSTDAAPFQFDVDAPPPKQLSETNLFLDVARQIPNRGFEPYDLNTPLFSDYAGKYRFVYVPPGKEAVYDEEEEFEFPVGTVIAKTFSFLNDLRDPSAGERIVETRLLVRKTSGWAGYPYIWNEDLTEARLAVAGGISEVSWTHTDGNGRFIEYIIPNVNQCKQCHEKNGAIVPIGPKARHLNRTNPYPEGAENQIERWTRLGLLTGVPADPESIPRVCDWGNPDDGTTEERARAWLDINCANCHNPEGSAKNAGLDLTYGPRDPVELGVKKDPVAAGPATGGRAHGIEPGSPDLSILLFRIETSEPAIMMPPMPRRLVHAEAADLIRKWIAEMPAQ